MTKCVKFCHWVGPMQSGSKKVLLMDEPSAPSRSPQTAFRPHGHSNEGWRKQRSPCDQKPKWFWAVKMNHRNIPFSSHARGKAMLKWISMATTKSGTILEKSGKNNIKVNAGFWTTCPPDQHAMRYVPVPRRQAMLTLADTGRRGSAPLPDLTSAKLTLADTGPPAVRWAPGTAASRQTVSPSGFPTHPKLLSGGRKKLFQDPETSAGGGMAGQPRCRPNLLDRGRPHLGPRTTASRHAVIPSGFLTHPKLLSGGRINCFKIQRHRPGAAWPANLDVGRIWLTEIRKVDRALTLFYPRDLRGVNKSLERSRY
ncbi:hypothetical protein B0H19DRAFT_1071578 [Mycena capillaripes]|nr:hypothetical protein B0H19DRAFT_1071578 [Mycena capillaripes]